MSQVGARLVGSNHHNSRGMANASTPAHVRVVWPLYTYILAVSCRGTSTKTPNKCSGRSAVISDMAVVIAALEASKRYAFVFFQIDFSNGFAVPREYEKKRTLT